MAITLKGKTSVSGKLIVGSSYDSLVIDWLNRVAINGGSTNLTTAFPSKISALNTFCQSLRSFGLLSKIKSLNTFFPECDGANNPPNLVGMLTPLIKTVGNDPWTNNNFVVGDATVNGLLGNGSTKYLETNIDPSAVYTSSNSGYTCYVYFPGSVLRFIGLDASEYYFRIGGTTWRNSHWTVLQQGSVAYGGYVSSNHVGGNLSSYIANSSNPHASLASQSVTDTAPPAGTLRLLGNINANYFSEKMSFAAIHNGLTTQESSDFYNIIQTLRTGFGGGYI